MCLGWILMRLEVINLLLTLENISYVYCHCLPLQSLIVVFYKKTFYLYPTSFGQNSVVHVPGCYCEQITALTLHILCLEREGWPLSHTDQLRKSQSGHCLLWPASLIIPTGHRVTHRTNTKLSASWPDTYLVIRIQHQVCMAMQLKL